MIAAGAVLLALSIPPQPARGADGAAGGGAGSCPTAARWVAPGCGEPLADDQVIARMAERPVVLLGEHHDDPDHHLWQLATLAALQARRPDLIVGFEMFPRAVQPVLDGWVAGRLRETDFLEQVRWYDVWGFDPGLYLPLLRFVRLYGIPVLALNVDRALVRRTAREGWDSVPSTEREGVGDPAPALPAYEEYLARISMLKEEEPGGGGAEAALPEPTPEVLAAKRAEPGFRRFVEAQQLWDRAMAEALAAAARRPGAPLVVGIVGRGHVDRRWGIPHQLADLGLAEVGVLVAETRTVDCAALPADLADAVFLLPPPVDGAQEPPRLGVQIADAEGGGARIVGVQPDSIAATAGLEPDDIIHEAAGRPVAGGSALRQIIGSVLPGTHLPLAVRRDGATREVIARFPAPRR